MLKNLLSIITISLIFTLDTDWKLHQNHEISMNKLIIKIDDAQAPKLGSEEPLSIINLQDLINMPESINFK